MVKGCSGCGCGSRERFFREGSESKRTFFGRMVTTVHANGVVGPIGGGKVEDTQMAKGKATCKV